MQRDLSVHPHNDRGTAVAAAELAVMAGAERVEGTLFGNGERTGNVDIVTLALNLYSQGVDPNLISPTSTKPRVAPKRAISCPIHPRHPYVGDLVFTAFSGSHQDAIKKGLRRTAAISGMYRTCRSTRPISAAPTTRSFASTASPARAASPILLERDYQLVMPRRLQIEFSQVVQATADITGKELTSQELWELFDGEYLVARTSLRLPLPPAGRIDGRCRQRAHYRASRECGVPARPGTAKAPAP